MPARGQHLVQPGAVGAAGLRLEDVAPKLGAHRQLDGNERDVVDAQQLPKLREPVDPGRCAAVSANDRPDTITGARPERQLQITHVGEPPEGVAIVLAGGRQLGLDLLDLQPQK
jgi:hypothetical protein